MTTTRIGALRHGKKRREAEKAAASRTPLYADMQWTEEEIARWCNSSCAPLIFNRIECNSANKQSKAMNWLRGLATPQDGR